MNDLFDLNGKLAIITGGSGLLGFQHARALLQKNCSIVIWDLDSKAMMKSRELLLEEFPGQSVETQKIDVSSETEITEVISVYIKNGIKIDILINNAAINPKFENIGGGQSSNFEHYPIETWNKEIGVGLTGAMLCSKHVGSQMAKSGGGVILNISSDLSVISPDQRIYEKPGIPKEYQFKKPVSYSVIKAGIVGLTKFLSTYWVNENVRVNSLSPGGIYDNQEQLFVENVKFRIPMARMAEVDEYVGAVQFLCSNASAYMTGQNLVIDGGRSVW
jgi:NAD(P)-dependent dehydrogenase (short-subunit alcohol dehydrogenase family)